MEAGIPLSALFLKAIFTQARPIQHADNSAEWERGRAKNRTAGDRGTAGLFT
jgi:hypothetical protein